MKLLRGEIKEAEREKRTAERGARFTRGCDARNKVRKGRSPEIDLHAVGEHLPRPTSLLLPFRRSRRLKKKRTAPSRVANVPFLPRENGGHVETLEKRGR